MGALDDEQIKMSPTNQGNFSTPLIELESFRVLIYTFVFASIKCLMDNQTR